MDALQVSKKVRDIPLTSHDYLAGMFGSVLIEPRYLADEGSTGAERSRKWRSIIPNMLKRKNSDT